MSLLDLKQFTSFSGQLSLGDNAIDLTFKLRVIKAGALVFEFSKLPLNAETKFINDEHSKGGSTFSDFNLKGAAEDGTIFESNEFQLHSVNWNIAGPRDERITFEGGCTHAKLVRPSDFSPLPRRTVQLKGFSNYGSLHATCELGKVAMDGRRREPNADSDVVTGWIAIEPEQMPPDVQQWRNNADKLLDHVKLVMSLAAAAMLKSPVRHFQFEDRFEIEYFSQTGQHADSLRIFGDVEQEGIFQAAVSSFFAPPIAAKNLPFAIEWFAMGASYNEVRLANAMTALENLISSNLDESDTFIQEPRHFEKITRRALRNTIRACIERWPTAQAEEALSELNEKLGDLNRRSLYRKVMILAGRWGVQFDGIEPKQIRDALRARNSVVHRGHYYDSGEQDNNEMVALWDHAMVVREIVARFLLTAIGYRGHYTSYVGGFHRTTIGDADHRRST